MRRALLIGQEPPVALGFEYVKDGQYEAIVIGSLTLGQLLKFREETVLSGLAQGMEVYLYTPGLPESPRNRALACAIATAQRELKNWGILFTDGGRRRVITAQEAKQIRLSGGFLPPGAVLTPLAKEILEGLD